MKTTQIKKKINSVTAEIEDLQSRLANVEIDLTRKKSGIDLDDKKAREELQSLKSDRDLLLELIEEKRSTLERLSDDLKAQSAIEERQQTIDQLIELAEKAESLEDEYYQEMQALDKLLQEKIPEILRIKQNWKECAKGFMDLGDISGLGKGLRSGTSYTLSRNDRHEELNADALLEELEGMGANLRPVRSGAVLSSQYFTHITTAKPLELYFGEQLHGIMEQRNVWNLLKEING